jgi:hypothetical protein
MSLFTNAIIGKLALTLVEEGWRIEFCDQDGGGLFVYAAPADTQIPHGNVSYWVHLEPANKGADVIADYTIQEDFSAVVEKVIDYANKLESVAN